MTLFTVLLPALNFLLMITFSRVAHWKPLSALIIASMAAELAHLVSEFPSFVRGESHAAVFGSWVHSGLFEVNWTFSIDALTYMMLIVVLTVSTLVHVYSTEYMSEDPHINRFISYLSLFTFFMLLLITADNFVNLFLGWEGVGLCSYLLISFWFTRIQANKAAIKAMVVNRIADLAFTVGMLALFYTFQTTEFNVVFGLTPYLVDTTIPFCGGQASPVTLIAILLFLGAMGKSAQIGLHTWLPDAMEGPTPVSALIHAATMVTAGVFLLIRSSSLYEFAPSALELITVIGASTAFMAATSGLLQSDLKKVIAYSTCSQLGYMVFACGLSSYSLSLFHLTNHAFFKALLFLSAGSVIHGLSNEQDMRRFGGLARILPYTYAMFVIGSLALMGFPFLTGFYSKDLLLEVAASIATDAGAYAYLLGLITALFTAYYSFRLLNLVFYGTSRSPRTYLLLAHELTPRMALALAVLAIGSIFFGYVGRDLYVGLGTLFWLGTIAQLPETTGAQLAGEFLALLKKMAPLFSCVGTAAVILVNETSALMQLAAVYQTSPRLVNLSRFLTSKWGFDAVYNRVISHPLLRAAYNITFSLIDKGVLEVFGPTGGGKIIYAIGTFLARIQTGRVYEYAAFMIGVIYLTLAMFNSFLGPLETISLPDTFIFPLFVRECWAWIERQAALWRPHAPREEDWVPGAEEIWWRPRPKCIRVPGKVTPSLKGRAAFSEYLLDKLARGSSPLTPLYRGIIYLLEGHELFDAYSAYKKSVRSLKDWHAQIDAYRIAVKAATPSERVRVQADYAQVLATGYDNFYRAQELFHRKYELTYWGAQHLNRMRSARETNHPADRGLEALDDAVKQAREMARWYEDYKNNIDNEFTFKDSVDYYVESSENYVADAEPLNNIVLDLAEDLGFLSYAAGSVPTYFALPLVLWHILFYVPLVFCFALGWGVEEPGLKNPHISSRPGRALPFIILATLPLDSSGFADVLLPFLFLLFALHFLPTSSTDTSRQAKADPWRQ